MSKDSGPSGTLSERLRQKSAERERRLEELYAEQLGRLEAVSAEQLQAHVERMSGQWVGAQRTIEAATGAATRRLGGLLLRAWLRSLVAGIAIVVGLSLGSWGVAAWQWRQIEARSLVLAELEQELGETRELLQELARQTRGVRLAERANGVFVVLPAGAETGWTVNGRLAVKLPE